jgi:hypothetical protein
MTLVKSLHSSDSDMICPVWQWMHRLASADVLAADRCSADAFQVLIGPHPSAVHVCSMFMYIHATHALGGAMSRAFYIGRALICRCSEQLLTRCPNGSFQECSPSSVEAQVWFPAGTCQPWMEMTLVKSLQQDEIHPIPLSSLSLLLYVFMESGRERRVEQFEKRRHYGVK